MNIHASPELRLYLDEPKQRPSGSVGKNGLLHLGFERRGEKTVLVDVERHIPFNILRALYWDEALPNMPCVFMITTTGCVLQGDRLKLEVEMAPNTQAHITTQSMTKIHSMDANYASQIQEFKLQENSYLEYLPDPTIPHAHSRFIGHTKISIDPTATLLYGETLMSGRKYHGENGEMFKYDLYSSMLEAEGLDGKTKFIEKFIVKPYEMSLDHLGIMAKFDIYGNAIVLTPKSNAERIFERVESFFDLKKGLGCGISHLPNEAGLIYKVVGVNSSEVREYMQNFWLIVRQEVTGAKEIPQFLWR